MANLYSKKDAEGMGNGKLELLARCCAHGKFDLYSLSMPNLSVWCDRTPKWRPLYTVCVQQLQTSGRLVLHTNGRHLGPRSPHTLRFGML